MDKHTFSRRTVLGALGLGTAVYSLGLHAESTWPSKPIRIIVPVAAGGIIDLLARAVAKAMTSAHGMSVVVESKPGADHIIGTQYVAKADPDGYTWLFGSVPFTVTPSLRMRPGYDPLKDFTPLQLMATSPNVLVVPSSVPARTVAEFVALAKQEKGALNYANPGNGSSNHLGMETFKSATGTDILGVPYKGQPPAITDLLSGRVQAMMISTSLAPNYIATGQLRALAVVAPQRIAHMPDVPTMTEVGYPSVDVIPWFGLLAPSQTPAAITEQASKILHALLGTPGLQTDFKTIGATPYPPNSPDEFKQHIQRDLAKWPGVVERAGLVKS